MSERSKIAICYGKSPARAAGRGNRVLPSRDTPKQPTVGDRIDRSKYRRNRLLCPERSICCPILGPNVVSSNDPATGSFVVATTGHRALRRRPSLPTFGCQAETVRRSGESRGRLESGREKGSEGGKTGEGEVNVGSESEKWAGEAAGWSVKRSGSWERSDRSGSSVSGSFGKKVNAREDDRAGDEETDDEQLCGRGRTPREGEPCKNSSHTVQCVVRGPVVRIGIVFR